MAGDWIKVRVDLYRDPKVIAIADDLLRIDSPLSQHINQFSQCDRNVTRNVMRNATVGALSSVWGICRVQGRKVGDDLHVEGVPVETLDDIAELQGFGKAMERVGWVVDDGNTLVFPKFFKDHNSGYENQKQKNRERQQRLRDKKKLAKLASRTEKENVTLRNGEKRREEKSKEKGTYVPFLSSCDDERESPGDSPKRPKRLKSSDIDAVVEAWNAIEGVRHARLPLTDGRRRAICARLRDPGWDWRAAMARVAASSFCRGGGGKGWRADIDWFLQPDVVTKALEGKYNDRPNSGNGSGGSGLKTGTTAWLESKEPIPG